MTINYLILRNRSKGTASLAAPYFFNTLIYSS